MKNIIVLFSAFAALELFARLPQGWSYHGWSNFKPFAKAEVRKDGDGGEFRIYDVQGKSGTMICRDRKIDARCGDEVVITFEARGKGSVSSSLRHFDSRGVWNPPPKPNFRRAGLSPEWKPYRFKLKVLQGAKAPTAAVSATLGCSKGGEMEVRAFTARHRPSPEKLPEVVPEDTFDPEKAGWKLSFFDDFNGPAGAPADGAEWEALRRKDFVKLDGKGNLNIACDFKEGTKQLESASLWTRRSWLYGYFEARLKFTRNNGWWSSFWLYGWNHRNPSEDGSEIDIYEDSHTRHRVGGVNPLSLDHTLHLYLEDRLKSFSERKTSPGSIDDFHVVGCKWTPFEISVYIDGRRVTTFDAFKTGTVRAPLHAILSGCIMRSWGARDTTGFTFPEQFTVDYVKVWEYPRRGEVQVDWKGENWDFTRAEGEELVFEADVRSVRPLKAAYLFDSGTLVGVRSAPPWKFTLPFSEAGFDRMNFLETGSQGISPDWRGMMHSFLIYAVDEKGEIGITGEPRRCMLDSALARARGVKAVQKIPGTVAFSDAPSGEAPKLRTNDIVECKVEAEKDAIYEGTLYFRSARDDHHKIFVLVDGELADTLRCPPAATYAQRRTVTTRLKLSAGRHTLSFVPVGFIFAGPMEFRETAAGTGAPLTR